MSALARHEPHRGARMSTQTTWTEESALPVRAPEVEQAAARLGSAVRRTPLERSERQIGRAHV